MAPHVVLDSSTKRMLVAEAVGKIAAASQLLLFDPTLANVVAQLDSLLRQLRKASLNGAAAKVPDDAEGEPEESPIKILRSSGEEGLTPLQMMGKRNKGMHSEASCKVGTSFSPRPSDVFVVTYPKCGTTWMTQICHQLRSRGHIGFEEITCVCPWDILAYDCGQDLDADQSFEPRVFKSHESEKDIAKGGRYIHVCRDPMDAFISFYRFLPAWAGLPPGSISAEEFAEAVFGGVSHSGGIWDFYVGWWERRHDPNVLWVCYEDLKSDLRTQILRVASFMGVDMDEKLLKITQEHSSFGFMAERSTQFDEHWVFSKVRDQMGIPQEYVFGDVSVSKVRAGGGSVGEGNRLPPRVAEMLRKRWETTVAAKAGPRSYEEMRRAVGELSR